MKMVFHLFTLLACLDFLVALSIYCQNALKTFLISSLLLVVLDTWTLLDTSLMSVLVTHIL